MSDELSLLGQFSGQARLFPLPNFVLFPCVIHPLHIFEPRYRQMTADALEDDRLIAMALLRPGWEADYDQRPPVHPVVCLGKVVSNQRLDDGRYNILLQGVSRARILEEFQTDRLYRVARVELLSSQENPAAHEDRRLRRRLAKRIPRWFGAHPQLIEQFQKLLESGLALGALSDVMTFALPLEPACKQELLEELSIERRVLRLLEEIRVEPPAPPTAADRKFPPEFSTN
jgi:Lon protease-like protein